MDVIVPQASQAEHYLKEAANVVNTGDKRGRLTNGATRYLRHVERRAREKQKKDIEKLLSRDNIARNKVDAMAAQQARQRLVALEDDLEKNAPPTDLKGETRDALAKRLAELKAEIVPAMQPVEVMRKNPAGAVGKFLTGEGSAAMKRKILEAKNLMCLLEPDSDDPDLCNIEKWRPEIGTVSGATTFMGTGAIPGHFAMSAQAKENWPANMPEFGTLNHPMAQAEAREKALAEQLAALQTELETIKSKVGTKCEGCDEILYNFSDRGVHARRHKEDK